MAGPAHTIYPITDKDFYRLHGVGKGSATVILIERSSHHLWPPWVGFLVLAVLLVMVAVAITWVARRIARRTRPA